MSGFAVGDRVVVTEFDSLYSCDLTGYYGHVDYVSPGMVGVALRGCVDGAPDRGHVTADLEDTKPFPFFPRELRHVD